MEQEEIQNITSDSNLVTAEVGEGIDFEKRGGMETGTPADLNVAEIHKNVSADIVNETELVPDANRLPGRPTQFAKVEKSLASLGFFTPSSRRIKSQRVKRIGFTREIDGKRVEVSAEIHPSGVFGLPVTADQDKYLALQKIITNTLQSEGKVTNPIRFKSSELLRLLNTSTKTGKNYKAISEWLDVMSATTIISDGAVYATGQKRFARDRFRVFDRALSFGKELDDGTVADANYIWLSAWQLENINNKFLVPIDLETYRELKNHIAKALVPLLQVWLFASKKAESFEKRYDELCEILTLQIYRSPSQILRQFKPSLDELTHHGYIEKWRVEKTADRKAYKIIFVHGPKFHRDRRRRLEQKDHTGATVVVGEFEGLEPSLPEPGRQEITTVKNEAIQNRTVKPTEVPDAHGKLVDALSARGLMPSTVLKLLESLPSDRLETISDYVEYFDQAGKAGEVGPGFLYDLIKNGDPLPASFETLRQRTERLAGEARSRDLARQQEILKAEYDVYRRDLIDRTIASLPSGEFESRVASYLAQPSNQSDYWKDRPDVAAQFAGHAVRAEISKGVSVLSYEGFCYQKLSGNVTNLGVDPTSHPMGDMPNIPKTGGPQEGLMGEKSESIIKNDVSIVSAPDSSMLAEYGL